MNKPLCFRLSIGFTYGQIGSHVYKGSVFNREKTESVNWEGWLYTCEDTDLYIVSAKNNLKERKQITETR